MFAIASSSAIAAVKIISTTSTTGRKRIAGVTGIRYQSIRAMSSTPPTAKSTAETITAENGKISRGKYTFATRLMFVVSELTENRSDDAKKFQASNPQ